jgi:hypothetical protein
VCTFKPRNRKITNSVKFFDKSLYVFSAELLTIYDYNHKKVKLSKDLERFVLSGKILEGNGFLTCEMRNDQIQILDSKTLNLIDKFEFEAELTGHGIL